MGYGIIDAVYLTFPPLLENINLVHCKSDIVHYKDVLVHNTNLKIQGEQQIHNNKLNISRSKYFNVVVN